MQAMEVSHLVLASASPRRREILERAGFCFEIDVAGVEELQCPGESPLYTAIRLALEKAGAVACRRSPGDLVLGADTTVVVEGEGAGEVAGGVMLGKPEDRGQAVDFLMMLAGRNHLVYTGWALLPVAERDAREAGGAAPACGFTRSVVRMREFGRSEAERYVEQGESDDKAGGYAVQGLGRSLVAKVIGCVDNVIGLPIEQLEAPLARGGVRPEPRR
jgi:septum formation protein